MMELGYAQANLDLKSLRGNLLIAYNLVVGATFMALIVMLLFHDRVAQRPGDFNAAGLESFKESGLGGVEFGHGEYWRWAFGPESVVSFSSKTDRSLVLHYRFNNPISGQSVRIFVNGNCVQSYESLSAQFFGEGIITSHLTIHATAGENTINIVYDDWNGQKSKFIDSDMKYALCFYRIFLSDN